VEDDPSNLPEERREKDDGDYSQDVQEKNALEACYDAKKLATCCERTSEAVMSVNPYKMMPCQPMEFRLT